MWPLGIAALAGGAIIAWYMQRRPPRRVALSFGRFLPEPEENPTQERRFALKVPVRSLSFWLHLIMLLTALAAIGAKFTWDREVKADAIGLRFVLDVSHSMSVADGNATRLDRALEAIETQRQIAKDISADTAFCEELVTVSQSASAPRPLAEALPLVAVQPHSSEVASLLKAAETKSESCEVTHTLIITDQVKPSGALGTTTVGYFWHQVGAPQDNIGIIGAEIASKGMATRTASLIVDLLRSGAVPPPQVTLQGPNGVATQIATRSLDREDRFKVTFPILMAGEYKISLPDGGAYSGDDLASLSIPEVQSQKVEWRLADLRAPSGLEASNVGPLVTGLEDLSDADLARPIIIVGGQWTRQSSDRTIGVFINNSDIFNGVNFDVLEQNLPSASNFQLPQGFVPTLMDSQGGVLIAERQSPRGIILPPVSMGGGSDLRNLSLTFFYNGLRALLGDQVKPMALTWENATGQKVSRAWLEGDTARALSTPDALTPIAVDQTVARTKPVWPYFVLIALIALILERVWKLRVLTRKRR